MRGMDKLVIKPGERVSHAYIVASASEEARRETAQRLAAAMQVAHLWNIGKVIHAGVGD